MTLTLLSSPLRNYGGVYVGLPADLTTVAASQAKPTRKVRLLNNIKLEVRGTFVISGQRRRTQSTCNMVNHSSISVIDSVGSARRSGREEQRFASSMSRPPPSADSQLSLKFQSEGLKVTQDTRYSRPIELNPREEVGEGEGEVGALLVVAASLYSWLHSACASNYSQRRGGPVQHVVPFRAGHRSEGIPCAPSCKSEMFGITLLYRRGGFRPQLGHGPAAPSKALTCKTKDSKDRILSFPSMAYGYSQKEGRGLEPNYEANEVDATV
ncbi:hypothetical protein Q8A73_004365 [Channa argus]|nr:hypothetical protein Q8A73_004365 [Channa argus]